MSHDDQLVWVRGGKSNRSPIYHTKRDCPTLEHTPIDPVAKRLSVLFDDMRECKWCAGDVQRAEYQSSKRSFAQQHNPGVAIPNGGREYSTCLVCEADKEPGEPCGWCARFDAIHDLDPRVDLAHLYALAGACENGQGEVAVRP